MNTLILWWRWYLVLVLSAASIWLFVPVGVLNIPVVQALLFIIYGIAPTVPLMPKDAQYELLALVLLVASVVLHPWTRFIALGACAAAGLLLWSGHPWGLTLLVVSVVWFALSLWVNLKGWLRFD